MTQVFNYKQEFVLESGIKLSGFHLAYTTLGTMNKQSTNVVWIFHTLTANSNPQEWWNGLVGEGKVFSPKKYFIICVNMPGSCYGSSSPLDKDENGKKYYHNFHWFTIKDMVKSYQLLAKHLSISTIKIGIGGSMGGQQLLQWAALEPLKFNYIIPIATNAQHSPWGIAFNATQRMAIEADTTWHSEKRTAGNNGLGVARSIALLSYRHYTTYCTTQKDVDFSIENFKAESYQRHQAKKIQQRFNAFSYYFLTKAMDSHNIGTKDLSVHKVLETIQSEALVIGISTDVLFPEVEQQFIAKHLPNASYCSITSLYGHDGFLLEYRQLKKHINSFLKNKKNGK